MEITLFCKEVVNLNLSECPTIQGCNDTLVPSYATEWTELLQYLLLLTQVNACKCFAVRPSLYKVQADIPWGTAHIHYATVTDATMPLRQITPPTMVCKGRTEMQEAVLTFERMTFNFRPRCSLEIQILTLKHMPQLWTIKPWTHRCLYQAHYEE